jgi:CRP-like cAMP-binding protein
VRENEIHRVLSTVEVLRDLRSNDLRHVIAGATVEEWEDGDTIVREHGQPFAFFVVLEGTARVVVGDETVSTLNAGDSFGELGLLDHGTRSATVVADRKLRTLAIPRVTFYSMIESNPAFARRVEEVGRARVRGTGQPED